MSHFFKSGSSYQISSSSGVFDQLPVANYVLKCSPMTGFYLEETEGFKLPPKVYGNTNNYCQRILNTFRQRDRNTGVLLVGEKGSGKTLMMRQVAINSGLPVVIIDSSFTGDSFNSFISSITQPCIILFDEFEKVYKKEDQEQVLTLLDGTYQSNKLFIITSNSKYLLDDNMKNRPGRIYYLFEYTGLDEDFIREYCDDNLNDKSKIDKIVELSKLFDQFNFDMLAAVVEEINRYEDEPSDLIKILNAKPEYCGKSTYSIDAQIMNHRCIPSAFERKTVDISPYSDSFSICVYFCWDDQMENTNLKNTIRRAIDYNEADVSTLSQWIDEGVIAIGKTSDLWGQNADICYDYMAFGFTQDDIIRYEGRSIIFKNEDGVVATLTRTNNRR
jgi:hypothetical protein